MTNQAASNVDHSLSSEGEPVVNVEQPEELTLSPDLTEPQMPGIGSQKCASQPMSFTDQLQKMTDLCRPTLDEELIPVLEQIPTPQISAASQQSLKRLPLKYQEQQCSNLPPLIPVTTPAFSRPASKQTAAEIHTPAVTSNHLHERPASQLGPVVSRSKETASRYSRQNGIRVRTRHLKIISPQETRPSMSASATKKPRHLKATSKASVQLVPVPPQLPPYCMS